MLGLIDHLIIGGNGPENKWGSAPGLLWSWVRGILAAERLGLNVNETWFHLRLIYSYMIWAKWSDKKEEGEQWVGCKSKFIAGILLFSYHLKWMLWMIKKKKSMLTAAWNSNVYVPAFSRQIVRQWVIPFGSLWNAKLIGLSLHGHVLVILISDVQRP